MSVQGPRSRSDGFRYRRWSSVQRRFRLLVRPAPAWLALLRRPIRAVADFARGDQAVAAVAILPVAVGLGVSWFPASKSRQGTELGPCHRVVEVVRFEGARHESRGSILVVRIERVLNRRGIGPHLRGDRTCNPKDLDLPIPPVPNVVFRRRGSVFEPLAPPRRREAPHLPIPSQPHNRLSESSPPHTAQETT